MKIPECLKDTSSKGNLYQSVHTNRFSWESYRRSRQKHTRMRHRRATTGIIAFNTHLAPLKTASIPRLKLVGASIGLRLENQVHFTLEIPLINVAYRMESLNFGFGDRAAN